MKIHLAGAYSNTNNKTFPAKVKEYIKNNNIYSLESFFKIKKMDYNLPQGWQDYFILDSGAFTFIMSPKKFDIDWEKYTCDYANFILKYKIKYYIELDIDKVIGLSEVERLRKLLEKQVGYKCMPVWHINRGYDKWLEICRDYNYICFGCFLSDGLKQNKYKFLDKFLFDAKQNNCKVHGLGQTNNTVSQRYKFYSVDSMTWCYGSIKEVLFFFDGCKMIRYENLKKRIKMDIVQENNFFEWIKFQKYAEVYL